MSKQPKTKKPRVKKPVPLPANPQPLEKPAKVLVKPGTAKKPPVYVKPVHPKAKITFRHNILPPVLGILMFAGVLGLLNAQWIVAQYRYRFVKPASESSIIAKPASTDPNAQPSLMIPAINLKAPIVTDEKSYDAGKVQLALRRGVVQYGAASANPGQIGNLVIVGHSSGQLWAPGDYKFVFTLLDKVTDKQRIFIDYKGTRYIYRVSDTKIVTPNDLSVIQPNSDEPMLTLITCTPVGTSKNRLVVTAKQVSPRPETAAAANTNQKVPLSGTAIPN